MLVSRQVITTLVSRAFYLSSRKCHSLFGIKDIIRPEQHEPLSIELVKKQDHEMAVDMIKNHYLPHHVFVRTRNMDVADDHSIDEYLIGLFKQGNSLFAKTDDGRIAGICVNFACSPVDSQNLRSYAFYRQDPNTKDYLYFIAKLQETPNLWNLYKQPKVFEIKMLAVSPDFRRQGVATTLAKKSKAHGQDQGYNIVRMDCVNPYDYKIAEHCMLSCLVKFPLHKLRGLNAPFIKRSSEHNKIIRVYVEARVQTDLPDVDMRKAELESMFE